MLNNNNNNQTFGPKFWGQLYILNGLAKVGLMYFHSQSHAQKKKGCSRLMAKLKYSHYYKRIHLYFLFFLRNKNPLVC